MTAFSCKSGGSGGGGSGGVGGGNGEDDGKNGGSNFIGYTIMGRVRSAITGGKLAGAQVVLRQGSQIAGTATTGSDGDYAFTGMPGGSYQVEAASGNYRQMATATFTVSSNKSNIDITLDREWPVDGSVLVGELVAGTPGVSGSGSDTLINPFGIAFGPDGSLYIVDDSQKIRKVTPGNPTITDFAGTGDTGFADGPAAKALFNSLFGLCFAPNGDIYVADGRNHRIRKISNGEVTTVAGTGELGSEPGGTLATETALNLPFGLTFVAGELYFSNHAGNRVQRITNGVIFNIAGDGTEASSGDEGAAPASQVWKPAGLAAGPDALYIAEYGSHTVRKINMQGNISTVAGTGTPGAAVNQLRNARAVAVDAVGTLYIADSLNHRLIRVYNGTPTVIAGGTQGLGNGQMKRPEGIAIGPDGYIYVAENTGHRIMRY